MWNLPRTQGRAWSRVAALEAFGRHRVQAILGVVGVALAVSVSTTILAVNAGAAAEADREVQRLGMDSIVVRSASDSRRPLIVADADAVRARVPAIEAVSPWREIEASVTGPLSTQRVRLVAVLPEFARVRRIDVERGRFLRPRDEASAARVCVLNRGLARRLFGYRDPLGAAVNVGRSWFEVVGVLPDGEDDAVYVPLSALSARRIALAPDTAVDAVWIRVAPGADVHEAAFAIRAAVEGRAGGRRLDVIVARHLVASRDRTQRMFSAVGSIFALLLFLLGGVAITNLMLAAVIERTPEIGLRRAVGATRRDIVRQFVCEALAISAAGGLAGVAAGLLLSHITSRYTGWPTDVSLTGILAAVTMAALLGVASGAYPARKAGRVQPIEALLHD